MPGEEWYLEAYWTLSTERQIGGMAVGSIAWSAVIRYGSYSGLDRSMLDHFWTIISTMDSGYMKWMSDQHERHMRAKAPKAPKK